MPTITGGTLREKEEGTRQEWEGQLGSASKLPRRYLKGRWQPALETIRPNENEVERNSAFSWDWKKIGSTGRAGEAKETGPGVQGEPRF